MITRLLTGAAGLAACLAAASPAFAQEEATGPFTVSGEVALVSDYRFRGVSYTDEEMAIQGGITVNHDSGFYVGAWGSNLAGWGTFAGANMELDLIAGYSTEVSPGVTVDVGGTWFMYPGGLDKTDFVEFYGSVTGAVGPAEITAGVNYAPKQEALGKWYNNGASAVAGVYDNPGDKEDNFYMYLEGSAGIPDTPVSLNAHVGYSNGNSGLGPQGTSVAPTGEYVDWSLGADFAVGPLTLGVKYVDTNLTIRDDSAYLLPNFSNTKNGDSIADATVVFSVSAGF